MFTEMSRIIIIHCVLLIWAVLSLYKPSGRNSINSTMITYSKDDLFKLGRVSRNTASTLSADLVNKIDILDIKRSRGKRTRIPNSKCGFYKSNLIDITNIHEFNQKGSVLKVRHRKRNNKGVDFNNLIEINTNRLSDSRLKYDKIKFSHVNARSLSANLEVIFDELTDNDIIAVSETWFSDSDTWSINECVPSGYSIIYKNRISGRGGGVAVIAKDYFKTSAVNTDRIYPSFEVLTTSLKTPNGSFRIIAIYRPPSASESSFLEDFISFIEDNCLIGTPFIITGDFNFHFDKHDSPNIIKLNNILESFSLVQHISFPTHEKGHTLDVIITKSTSPIIPSEVAKGPLLTDHFAIRCVLDVPEITLKSKRKIAYRYIYSIDIESFQNGLISSDLIENLGF